MCSINNYQKITAFEYKLCVLFHIYMKRTTFLIVLLFTFLSLSIAKTGHTLTISGTTFLMDGKQFPFTGVSFFNALYNEAFNKSSNERHKWLNKFQRYGINVIRIWAQWDTKRGFVDANKDATLYNNADGTLRQPTLNRLKALCADADSLEMVIEIALFSYESVECNNRLGTTQETQAVTAVTHELMPFRNVVFQIWNEYDGRVLEHLKTIKSIDSNRLVTNSPGFPGKLGTDIENSALDFLTPHTSRQFSGRPWELAPQEIAFLLNRFRKPVVDDEPARNGTANFGGPNQITSPYDHILQIYSIWRLGAYINYHHDMFQVPGNSSVPPNGIPDPEFSPYHRQVFEFISHRERFQRTECINNSIKP